MDIRSKEEFNYFMRRALASNTDDCYIELYNSSLRYVIPTHKHSSCLVELRLRL
jgi:hypothetical protein